MRLAVILALLLTPTLAMAKANFYAQTSHFALKKGEEWSWDKVAKTPNIKWHNKKPQKNPSFSSYDVNGGMGKYGSLSASGSKAKPTIIQFSSSQAYAESENGANVYTLHQLFNKAELTKIKSNCSVDTNSNRMASGEYQHFYKWQKKGHQPLYVAVRRFEAGTFSGGIIMNYIIAKDFNNFNQEYIYDLERFDSNGDEITCRILK